MLDLLTNVKVISGKENTEGELWQSYLSIEKYFQNNEFRLFVTSYDKVVGVVGGN